MVEFQSEHGGFSIEVIKKAFDATEEEFLHLVKRSWPSRPTDCFSCFMLSGQLPMMFYMWLILETRGWCLAGECPQMGLIVSYGRKKGVFITKQKNSKSEPR
ncbi:hypothetical protein COLO4_14992 [Corchorus olitorius]|uniref:Uncharacterized protein n=1 Tax=Corchorus olitorius TaxID=93759 RepID=A0A1R3JPZ6_9ROSI|nr:hypothetical protein COLO4_14992 [Corchorus olitorius]